MKKAFTLIELMVAVSILAIGLVVIMRSLLSVVTALDTCSNDIYAVQLLDERMSALELQVLLNPQEEIKSDCEDVTLGNRDASLNQEVALFEDEEWGEFEHPLQTIDKAKMTLRWQQDDRERKILLETYFIKEKK